MAASKADRRRASFQSATLPSAMERLRFRRLWLALGLGFVALVIYLSLTPNQPDYYVPKGQKYGHVLAYTWLMIWYAQIYRTVAVRVRLAVLWCAMGIALEFVQRLTTYRTFSYFDMLLDAGGVALGLMLARTQLQNGLGVLERTLARWQTPSV